MTVIILVLGETIFTEGGHYSRPPRTLFTSMYNSGSSEGKSMVNSAVQTLIPALFCYVSSPPHLHPLLPSPSHSSPPHLHPPLHLTSPSSSPPHLHPPLHLTFTLLSTSPSLSSSPPHLHPPLHLTSSSPPHLFLSTSPLPLHLTSSSPPHLHPPLHLTFTLLSTSPSPSSPPHLHSPLHLTFTLPSTSPSRSSPPHLHPLPLYLTFTLFLSTSPSPSSPPHDALSDRLVCGLRNTGIQKRLLSEASLTLAKAGEIAQGMEAAEKNAKEKQYMYLSTKSSPGERRPRALVGENRRSRVTAVEEVDMCLVLADFGTLPATSARRKDTLLRHTGADQQHIDESCNRSPRREGRGKYRHSTKELCPTLKWRSSQCLKLEGRHTSP